MAATEKVDSLPLPLNEEDGSREWKQYLFYMIAYSDTFHDFSKERKLEGEGRSVSKEDIPNRVDFTLKLISKMDDSFPFSSIYYPIINSFRMGTFENNTYAAFTRILNNPLYNSIDEPAIKNGIQSYLPTVFSLPENEEIKVQDMNEKVFQTAGGIPDINSSVIELYMPAVVYTDTTQDNFINFLKVAYSDCLDGAVIKFVEDTASFPRNIFTTKLGEFKKIITSQTKWDPAGLSKFNGLSDVSKSTVSAPSFLSLYKYSGGKGGFNYQSAYFKQAEDIIVYPGYSSKITKCGPSVNHLFMHMALEGDDISGQLKEKFKIMIKAAKKDSKNNLVLALEVGAGKPELQDERLRKLTSSKRSGDYENIHSAMNRDALMFTGDEPAFTYGVLNKCPIIFHSSSATGHHFKLYIPPPRNPEIAKAAAEERALISEVLKAAELQKFFGGTDVFYKSYLINIQKAVFSSDNISVGTRKDVGRLLQVYMANELKLDTDFFNELVRSRQTFKELGAPPMAGLDRVDIKALQAGEFDTKLKNKLRSLGLEKLKESNSKLEPNLANVRKYIPLKFHQKLGSINMVEATLFKDNERGLPFLVNGAEKYKLEPGAMFPHYKDMEGNIGGIAKLLSMNEKTTNNILKQRNINTINGALEYMGITEIPSAAEAAAAVKYANDLINPWLATNGGSNKNKTRKVKKSSNKYLDLHKKILLVHPSKIPFKLTPKEYADMILYRYIINDVILEITPIEPTNPEVENNVGTNEPTELQDGGAVFTDEMKSYCIDLFNCHIEPFFRKHLENSPDSSGFTLSVLNSVVGGTFIQDIEMLLNEISGSPEFIGDSNSELYEGMKTIAATTLDGIFNKLERSYTDPKKILKINERIEGTSFDTIKKLLEYYVTTPIIIDRFFDDMNNIIGYLGNLFLETPGVAIEREAAEPAMFKADDNDIKALQHYVKYALNDYIDVEIIGVHKDTTGSRDPSVKGGSFQLRGRQRRRRNGSPRRKSLRRK